MAGHLAFLIDLMTFGWIYGVRILWCMQTNHIDVLHLNNSILINDFGIISGWISRKRVIVQVRAPEYPSKIAKGLSLLVDRFLPISKFVESSLLDLDIEPSRITVVPEGLNAKDFIQSADQALPVGLGNQKSGLTIGMVGCLVPWKGHWVFLDACVQVLKQIDAEFYIVGDTPDNDPGYKNQLIARAGELGILDHVSFLGHCPNVAPIIKSCDIIVHASTAPEPFGRVILEAMCLGKPVVATNAGGPAEVIDHGRDGLLVNPGEPESLAKAMITLISDRQFRCEMGRAGAKKVSRDYSDRDHARIILNAYFSKSDI